MIDALTTVDAPDPAVDTILFQAVGSAAPFGLGGAGKFQDGGRAIISEASIAR